MDAEGLLILIGLVLLGAGVAISRLRVDECRYCPHCRDERRRKDEEQKRLRAELEQQMGWRPPKDEEEE